MHALVIGLLVGLIIFACALIGLSLHRVLPEAQRSKETQDVVRLGTGMLSVLASLVLGLLIATAKTSYDETDHEIRSYAADLILLSETLRDYGGTADVPRERLRTFTAQMLEDIWPQDAKHPALRDNPATGEMLEHVREAIRALAPVDAGQKWLQDQALTTTIGLIHARWLLIAQEGSNVRVITLAILVAWIGLIFMSFGLNAPRNMTVGAAFLVCSLSIGGAVFLILQMDDPFGGTMKISAGPLQTALAHMPAPAR